MRCGELLREIEPARGANQNMRWKLADAYLQHFDADDIARLPDFARVLDVSIGHRGDVHQPVLVHLPAPGMSLLIVGWALASRK